MPAKPCGVYVYIADLINAVSGTPDIPAEMKSRVLELMEQAWHGQNAVDVMLMAENFWTWEYEMTEQGTNAVKVFNFEALMLRIKDEKIVPTIITGDSMRREETKEFDAIGLNIEDGEFKITKKTETKH